MRTKNTLVFVLSLLLLGLASCQSTTKSSTPADFEQSLNQITEVELGKMLYFDPRLSKDGTVSCNSCHNVMNGGSDNLAVSTGVRGQRGNRNSPTVFNAAFLSVQFWDGRSPNLKEQAKGPLVNPIEMGNKNHKEVVDRVAKIPGYVSAFKNVYPGNESLNIENLAQAIAAYEKTLVTVNSRFDSYQNGEENALTDLEKKGWETFKVVGCTSCHSGDHFAGPELPEGQGFYMKFPTFPNTKFDKTYKFTKDKGRSDVTKNKADTHMFRVPTLRNIALTAPYFHNGAVKELDEAVKVMAKTQLNKDLSDEEVNSIVAFLKSLTGNITQQTAPVLPPTDGYAVN